jgi:hypothetical protein
MEAASEAIEPGMQFGQLLFAVFRGFVAWLCLAA